jgi:choline-sulfatase
LLIAGSDIPAGKAEEIPVTLCDVSATILDAVGARDAIEELQLPGASLLDLIASPPQDRAALSEMHSFCPNGVFMLRTRRHKYIHHVGAPPQLYDLEADPEELRDIAGDTANAATLRDMEARLRAMLDPEAVDARAKADQGRLIALHGGEAAIRGRERMAYTPPPAS